MNKKSVFLYIVTSISIFIPSPPYFGYGFILIVIFNISLLVSIATSHMLDSLNDNYRIPIVLLFSSLTTVILHQIVTMISPIIGLTISFVVYLTPLSVLTFDKLLVDADSSSDEKRKNSFKVLYLLSFVALIFFLLREILAFGSISYPSPQGVITISLFSNVLSDYSFFWSSIPGALIQLAFFMVLLPIIFKNKIAKSEENNKEDLNGV